jgi:hypothetical protein
MNKELENNIMNKIKTGQVKLKSKYVFLAEKLGLGTAFTLSIVLSALLFNLILFYMKETDNLYYLSFGKNGVLAFLESFPYALVVAFILFIILAGYLITKSDVSYKKPFGYFTVSLIVFVMFLGGILTYTKIAEKIEKGNHPFNTILMKGSLEMRDKGIAGIVFEKGEDYLIVETPHGLRNIDLTKIEEQKILNIEKGNFVLAVGENRNYDFVAQEIQVLDKEKMPIINRGIDKKFKPFLNKKLDEENIKQLPPQLMHFDEEEKKCIKECFDAGKNPKNCFDECINP